MDISKVDPETLMTLYSIVFQDVTLFHDTILENIRLGKKGATDEEVLRAAKLANCDEFAEKLPNGWGTTIPPICVQCSMIMIFAFSCRTVDKVQQL